MRQFIIRRSGSCNFNIALILNIKKGVEGNIINSVGGGGLEVNFLEGFKGKVEKLGGSVRRDRSSN